MITAWVVPILNVMADPEPVECYMDLRFGDIIKFKRSSGSYARGRVILIEDKKVKGSGMMTSYYKEVAGCMNTV